jgi:hypothetical protein
VDNLCTPKPGLHHPLEAYGVILGHVRADVHNAV